MFFIDYHEALVQTQSGERNGSFRGLKPAQEKGVSLRTWEVPIGLSA